MLNKQYKIKLLKETNPKIAKQITHLLKQLVTPASIINASFLKKMLKAPSSFIFVAENVHGEIIGMATLIHTPQLQGFSRTTIEDVVVDSHYRQQGIGKALIKAAILQAKKLNAKTIKLTSRPSRVSANTLYKKLGFTLVNTNNYQYHI
jgi:ribosomal protein S18 acetylase RimI-like enzyme